MTVLAIILFILLPKFYYLTIALVGGAVYGAMFYLALAAITRRLT